MRTTLAVTALALAATSLTPPVTSQETKPATRLRPVRAARLVPAGSPEPKSQETLRDQRTEKLAKPVFKKANWLLDYDEARARAKAEGKWILTYFTRSYAP